MLKSHIIQFVVTTFGLLLFCILFPTASSAAAYIFDSAPYFAAVFVIALLISRRAGTWWWQEHIQLRGVGSKSRWQRQQSKNKER